MSQYNYQFHPKNPCAVLQESALSCNEILTHTLNLTKQTIKISTNLQTFCEFFMFFLGGKEYIDYICIVFRQIHKYFFAQIPSRTTTSEKDKRAIRQTVFGVHSTSVTSP